MEGYINDLVIFVIVEVVSKRFFFAKIVENYSLADTRLLVTERHLLELKNH